MAAPAASLAPISDKDFGFDQARHLLWRAGFGGTPAQIQTLASWGPTRAVDYLLNPGKVTPEPNQAEMFDKDIMRPPTPEQRRAYAQARRGSDEDALAKFRLERQMRERRDRTQIAQMQKWWLTRLIETHRPLEEKMTLFWHGHFATSYRTIENSYHMYLQNEFFRRNALGSFADLLGGIIRDPAMIAYLDNNDSRKGRPNENLARELLELFSLGIGRYSEQDIKEGARALTGYTFDDDAFVFRKNNHDAGAKTILGRQGNFDGDGFVGLILGQRACSLFIARKLYSFFAAELPPSERVRDEDLPQPQRTVVAELARALAQGEYALAPALRRLFLSEHFYDESLRGEQIKSPAVLVAGAARSLGTPVRDLGILNDALDLMGQNLFMPPSVKGWDGGRSWINTSTLFVRQNILAFLLTGVKPGGEKATDDYDPSPLLGELAAADPAAARDPARVVDYLLRLTLGSSPPRASDALLTYLHAHGNALDRERLTGLLLLITAMPEYQLC